MGNKDTSGDHPHYSIVKIGHNIERSTGDLSRFAFTQTPKKKKKKKKTANVGMKNSQEY